LGLGLDEFSVPIPSLLKIKKIIRSIRYEDTKELVEEALKMPTGKEVEILVNKKFKDIIYSSTHE